MNPLSTVETPARRAYLAWGLGAVALVFVGLALLAPHAHAQMPATSIVSAGPLSKIILGHDLSCQVRRADDFAATGDDELYPPSVEPGDCGTFLLVDATVAGTGTFYAPDFDLHGGTATSSIGAHASYTFGSESPAPTGSGTAADPFTVVTTSDAGTFTHIVQTDSYVVGYDWYDTAITISNSDASGHDYRLWRAGDCFLQGSDSGYGFADPPPPPSGGVSRVACTSLPDSLADRFEMWVPAACCAHYYHAGYNAVWSWIGGHTAFPDTCDCTVDEDNGAGLSWDFSIPAGGSITISHSLEFSLGEPPDIPPQATINFDNSFTTCQDSHVDFWGVATDADGSVVSVLWDLGDGFTSTSLSVSHTYANPSPPGGYLVSLTVTDDDGVSTTVTALVTSVGDPNCCPTINALGSYTVMEGGTVHFVAFGDDFEGDILTFIASAGRPSASSFDGSNGQFFWHTGVGDAGDYAFTVLPSDGFAHPADGPCLSIASVDIHVLPRPTTEQAQDSDGDSVEDSADNCPSIPNGDQADADRDGMGDLCERPPGEEGGTGEGAAAPEGSPASDVDRDGIMDVADNCPVLANHEQDDMDGDGLGDACDADLDGDGVPQNGPAGAYVDNCPVVPNKDQADADGDKLGDACQEGSGSLGHGSPAGDALGSAQAARDEASMTHFSGNSDALLMVGAGLGAALLVLGVVALAMRRRS